jgi:hypothetical protein
VTLNGHAAELKEKVVLRKPIWHKHPFVGNDKTLGEQVADIAKHWLGTWVAFWVAVCFFLAWLRFAYDPGWTRFNVILWITVVVQSIILQISVNRSDRVDSELALYTHQNTDTLMKVSNEILTINERQLQILNLLNELMDENTTLTRQIDSQARLLTEIRERVSKE